MKEEKKDYKQLYEETEKVYKTLIDKDAEMGMEITHLKRIVAGYKGRLQQLTQQLNQSETNVEEKTKTITALESQVKSLGDNLTLSQKTVDKYIEIIKKQDEAILEYNELPFLLRIFKKVEMVFPYFC